MRTIKLGNGEAIQPALDKARHERVKIVLLGDDYRGQMLRPPAGPGFSLVSENRMARLGDVNKVVLPKGGGRIVEPIFKNLTMEDVGKTAFSAHFDDDDDDTDPDVWMDSAWLENIIIRKTGSHGIHARRKEEYTGGGGRIQSYIYLKNVVTDRIGSDWNTKLNDVIGHPAYIRSNVFIIAENCLFGRASGSTQFRGGAVIKNCASFGSWWNLGWVLGGDAPLEQQPKYNLERVGAFYPSWLPRGFYLSDWRTGSHADDLAAIGVRKVPGRPNHRPKLVQLEEDGWFADNSADLFTDDVNARTDWGVKRAAQYVPERLELSLMMDRNGYSGTEVKSLLDKVYGTAQPEPAPPATEPDDRYRQAVLDHARTHKHLMTLAAEAEAERNS